MPHRKERRVFDKGHNRKFLVVIDETPEMEAALVFAAARVNRGGGALELLYVIEPQDFQHWIGVREVQREEETNKAKAIFRLFKRKLNNHGFGHIVVEEVIREGKTAEQVIEQIESDEDIAILILGASGSQKGPGPLVTALATGSLAGNFPIPVTIVPGTLTPDEIKLLA
jgi:nucleotide-binding universal stress UspA family protein